MYKVGIFACDRASIVGPDLQEAIVCSLVVLLVIVWRTPMTWIASAMVTVYYVFPALNWNSTRACNICHLCTLFSLNNIKFHSQKSWRVVLFNFGSHLPLVMSCYKMCAWDTWTLWVLHTCNPVRCGMLCDVGLGHSNIVSSRPMEIVGSGHLNIFL